MNIIFRLWLGLDFQFITTGSLIGIIGIIGAIGAIGIIGIIHVPDLSATHNPHDILERHE